MSTPSNLDALNERFAIPGIAKITNGNGGLPQVCITLPGGSAAVYLHGAQVTSWKPAGSEEVLFLSSESAWEDGKAIRGGIPICFPWFGKKVDDAKAPSHGFVRTKAWELTSLIHRNGTVTLTFETGSDASTKAAWPYEFRLVHRVTVGTELRLDLVMTNTGTVPLHFEEALHTYYRVGDVKTVEVTGVQGARFLDNTNNNRENTQLGDVLFKKATDNIYLATAAPLELIDRNLQRRIRIEKKDSQNTVIWNPWQAAAVSLPDLGDEEWLQMVCIEAANARAAAISLSPGGEHTMSMTLSVQPI